MKICKIILDRVNEKITFLHTDNDDPKLTITAELIIPVNKTLNKDQYKNLTLFLVKQSID